MAATVTQPAPNSAAPCLPNTAPAAARDDHAADSDCAPVRGGAGRALPGLHIAIKLPPTSTAGATLRYERPTSVRRGTRGTGAHSPMAGTVWIAIAIAIGLSLQRLPAAGALPASCQPRDRWRRASSRPAAKMHRRHQPLLNIASMQHRRRVGDRLPHHVKLFKPAALYRKITPSVP
ncbi:uncharacterized protein CC84DRAFT_1233650 [Paraphaeosphaeria sporulosa]|uniref:Uncharacterized protein n=1 Tax=Paraphaeosphaeria sporulosa TaxID=1460663 RepID=A0A177BVC4_9PLEO|nr:uncharacterized protein CC84DRAFT_1233650 [Paraphaeosphaeria sporulosa]OAF99105.1 hypothetical protein CC84DRAFT_1233650 [Paraphaeosphaeria sporulosa]